MTMNITTETIENVTYYKTEARKVNYTLYFRSGYWTLMSKRQSLGLCSMPTIRHFDNLAELEKKVKSFRGISNLLESKIFMDA